MSSKTAGKVAEKNMGIIYGFMRVSMSLVVQVGRIDVLAASARLMGRPGVRRVRL